MTIPAKTARTNPAAMVPRLAAKFGKSLPPAKSFHQAAPIFESGGIKTESKMRPASSHRTANDAMETRLVAARFFNDGSPSSF
jgi:hypothetical protein